jgi:hypothetical protein
MAVVIKPAENRLAMAKPPPRKLDAHEAGQISDARKKGWNSKCSHDMYSETALLMNSPRKDGEAFTLVTRVRKLGQHWKKMAKR